MHNDKSKTWGGGADYTITILAKEKKREQHGFFFLSNPGLPISVVCAGEIMPQRKISFTCTFYVTAKQACVNYKYNA